MPAPSQIHELLSLALEKKGIRVDFKKEGYRVDLSDGGYVIFDGKVEGSNDVIEVELSANYCVRLFKWYRAKRDGKVGRLIMVVPYKTSKSYLQKELRSWVGNFAKEVILYSLEEFGLDRFLGKPKKSIMECYLAHITCDKLCIRQFLFNITNEGNHRGVFLTALYLRDRGFNESEVREYLTELFGKKLDVKFIEHAVRYAFQRRDISFPNCNIIKKIPEGKIHPFSLKLGDLKHLKELCKLCKQKTNLFTFLDK